jgi:hypothetical protein
MNYDYLKDKSFLNERVGKMEQLASIKRFVFDDGKERGVKGAEVSNGSGLNFTVLLDRGMDIGAASFKGVPFAFLTPCAFSHPAYFDSSGLEWLRNWGGGLFTGCGMLNVGSPDTDLGLHGRLSNIPAENVSSSSEWINGKYQLSVKGEVKQSKFFFENLRLERCIKTAMGSNEIVIEDTIENCGFKTSPLMLLYHINLGYPLVSSDSELIAEKHELLPRDEEAASGIDSWNKFQKPTPDYTEQCFYHDLPEDENGFASISLANSSLGMAVKISFRKNELPNLIQWKQMGQGAYVTGLEPANCRPEGQSKERENGTLKEIQPGEIVKTAVKISLEDIS